MENYLYLDYLEIRFTILSCFFFSFTSFFFGKDKRILSVKLGRLGSSWKTVHCDYAFPNVMILCRVVYKCNIYLVTITHHWNLCSVL